MVTILHFFIIILTNLHAESVIRYDTQTVEDFTPFKHKYELIMEENCAYCLQQISIFKECVNADDVVIMMDTKKPEEEIKKFLRKKKIPYKVYGLSSELKKTYAFTGVTPTLWINKKSSTGVASCEYLKNSSVQK